MITLIVKGKTYPIKDSLKSEHFKWNAEKKYWSKDFPDKDKEYVGNLCNSINANGSDIIASLLDESGNDFSLTEEQRNEIKESSELILETILNNLDKDDESHICLNNSHFTITVNGPIIESEKVWTLYDENDEAIIKMTSLVVISQLLATSYCKDKSK